MKIKISILENVYERTLNAPWTDDWHYIRDTIFGEHLTEEDRIEANQWQFVQQQFIGPADHTNSYFIVLENLRDGKYYGVMMDFWDYPEWGTYIKDDTLPLSETYTEEVLTYFPLTEE